MVAVLMGLQGGFTKFPYYLCLWDSRNASLHYEKRTWPLRTGYEVGAHTLKQEPLVEPRKVLMPPLHIKLGLIKQFVKQLDPEGLEAHPEAVPEVVGGKDQGRSICGPPGEATF